jgi:hypothetical protein
MPADPHKKVQCACVLQRLCGQVHCVMLFLAVVAAMFCWFHMHLSLVRRMQATADDDHASCMLLHVGCVDGYCRRAMHVQLVPAAVAAAAALPRLYVGLCVRAAVAAVEVCSCMWG